MTGQHGHAGLAHQAAGFGKVRGPGLARTGGTARLRRNARPATFADNNTYPTGRRQPVYTPRPPHGGGYFNPSRWLARFGGLARAAIDPLSKRGWVHPGSFSLLFHGPTARPHNRRRAEPADNGEVNPSHRRRLGGGGGGWWVHLDTNQPTNRAGWVHPGPAPGGVSRGV